MRIALIAAVLPIVAGCSVLELNESLRPDPQSLACAESSDESSCADGGCIWRDARCEEPLSCSETPRDDCIASTDCILERVEYDAYVCRPAANDCERIPGSETESCNSTPGCEHISGSCYCPDEEFLNCRCAGGPPPMCLQVEACTVGDPDACPNDSVYEVCCPESATEGVCREVGACADSFEHLCLGWAGAPCPAGLECVWVSGDMGVCIDETDCASMQRDDCIASSQCVLELDVDRSYLCRPAVGECESIPGNMADACQAPNCVFDPDFCYCPADVVCGCGGGPPPVCRDRCGGIADWPCEQDYFCDRPMHEGGWPGPGYPECMGNYDQPGMCLPIPVSCDGAPSAPLCGCVDDVVPTTFASECERRLAGAAFSHVDACE